MNDVELTTAVSNMLNDLFEHKPGDRVVLAAVFDGVMAELQVNGMPDRFERRLKLPNPVTILERKLIQCHGGWQGFYTIRLTDSNSNHTHSQVATHEVISLDKVVVALKEFVAANPTKRGGEK